VRARRDQTEQAGDDDKATDIDEGGPESIIDALQKGDKIEIRGFGSFRTRQRRGRIGRNPKTGEKVEVPAKKIPFFKPSKELKDFVNTSATAIGEAAQ
jgi:integration host factor subunit beta